VGSPFAALHCGSISFIALGRSFRGMLMLGALGIYVGYSLYNH